MDDAWSYCPACGADNRAPLLRTPVLTCPHRFVAGSPYCVDCGAVIGQSSPQGPTIQQPGPRIGGPAPATAYQTAMPLDFLLNDCARRFRDSRKAFWWTLVGGTICLWPLWIITYLEYRKQEDIKSHVASLGVDVHSWMLANNLG